MAFPIVVPKWNEILDAFPLSEAIRAIRFLFFDFDGVFTNNKVMIDQNGFEMVSCSRSDGMGIALLHKIGMKMMVVSSETNPVVQARCEKLKIPCIYGCQGKLSVIKGILASEGVPPEFVAFMGNDVNDIECLDYVGLPIVVRDAHPTVIPHAKLFTDLCGGAGAVREICDLFLRVRSATPLLGPAK